MSDPYEVGYKKPPKHSQFKKGQSGNPRGRPPGRKSMSAEIRDVLDRKIVIKENGKIRKITATEALILQIRNKGLKGHFPSARLCLKLLNEVLEALPDSDRHDDTSDNFSNGRASELTEEEAAEIYRLMNESVDKQLEARRIARGPDNPEDPEEASKEYFRAIQDSRKEQRDNSRKQKTSRPRSGLRI